MIFNLLLLSFFFFIKYLEKRVNYFLSSYSHKDIRWNETEPYSVGKHDVLLVAFDGTSLAGTVKVTARGAEEARWCRGRRRLIT